MFKFKQFFIVLVLVLCFVMPNIVFASGNDIVFRARGVTNGAVEDLTAILAGAEYFYLEIIYITDA